MSEVVPIDYDSIVVHRPATLHSSATLRHSENSPKINYCNHELLCLFAPSPPPGKGTEPICINCHYRGEKDLFKFIHNDHKVPKQCTNTASWTEAPDATTRDDDEDDKYLVSIFNAVVAKHMSDDRLCWPLLLATSKKITNAFQGFWGMMKQFLGWSVRNIHERSAQQSILEFGAFQSKFIRLGQQESFKAELS